MPFLIKFQDYFTFEMIYLWINFGILPLWLLLIFLPSSNLCKILVNSFLIPLLFSIAYIYVIYQIILLDIPILNIFTLYLGIDDLYALFADEAFLLIFWLHFLTLNLFLGSWVSRDGVKYSLPRTLTIIPLILIYFTGPLGLVLYWMIRIFYAKKLRFHD